MPTDADPLVARLRDAGCVFAEDEAAVLRASATSPAELESFVAQRVAGLPLEQIVGWASFCGLRIRLLRGVFVPRVRSEHLVALASSLVRPGSVVVDLCCGSGALGAAVLASVPSATVFAADVDPVAVACARLNLPPSRVFEGDLFSALPPALRGTVDVLLAHAPYVPTSSIALMPPEARDHEHRVALDGGDDGLDVVRRILASAPAWLAPGGTLLFQVAVDQAPAADRLVAEAGLVAESAYSEEYDATVVTGRRV